MGFRTATGAVLVGTLIFLAGVVAAATVLALVVAVVPASTSGSSAFLWGSAAVAVLLHGLLGFAAARTAARRLTESGANGPAALLACCSGPIFISLLSQLGIAAQGRVALLLATVAVAAAGAAFGSVRLTLRAR